MPLSLPLRPTIAVAALVTTGVTLAGGLVLYFAAQDAVNNLVDNSAASLDDQLQESIKAVDQTTAEAERSILESVKAGSFADIKLFASLLSQSFSAVELQLETLTRAIKTGAHLYTSRQELEADMLHRLPAYLLGQEQKGDARVTGIGVSVVMNTEEAGNRPDAINSINYCFWDPMPDGTKAWYIQTNTRYTPEGWVVTYYEANNETGVLEGFSQDAFVADDVGYDRTPHSTEWQSPQTWLAESGQVALYLLCTSSFPVAVPSGHWLSSAGANWAINIETDLAHWAPLVRRFNAERSPEGSFLVADLEHGLGLAHTSEPVPDTSKDSACVNGESAASGDLAFLDSSACFPKLINFSAVTQSVCAEAAGRGYDLLFDATLCKCDGATPNCTAECEGEGGNSSYYIRKHHLFTAGAFELSVVWFRDKAELQGMIQERQREGQGAIAERRLLAETRAKETEANAEDELERALWVMVASVAASFALGVAVSLMWVLLLAIPLTHIGTSVQLMGDMKVEEAVQHYTDHSNGKVQVREMEAIAEGFLQAAAVLMEYRRYLPESVLLDEDEEVEDALCSMVPAPGVGRGSDAPNPVCIAFTDIQGSTSLWEDNVLNMSDVLSTHDDIIRKAGMEASGYEVKTIGDAFMFAFPTPHEGCRFALDVQLQLLRQTWPAQLLEHPNANKAEEVWNGLRIRIGMHYGEVSIVQNPTTKRYDYFGSTVNTAARVEAALRFGGLVGITQQMHEEVQGDLKAHVFDMGPKELKGLSAPVRILAIMPPSLAARERVFTEQQPPAQRTSFRRPVGSVASRASPRDSQMIPIDKDHSRLSRDTSGRVSTDSSADGSVAYSFGRKPDPSACSESAYSVSRRRRTSLGRDTNRLTNQAFSSAVSSISVSRTDLKECTEEGLRKFLTAQARSADRTHGVLHSVVSSYVIVTWNTSRSCQDPHLRCATYLMMDPRVPVSHGASSGRVLYGNVSASKYRFPNVVGGWAELAWRLSDEASQCGDYALVTPDVSAQCGESCKPHRAQLWRHIGTRSDVVETVVWSLALPEDETERRLCIESNPRPESPVTDAAFRHAARDANWFEFTNLPDAPHKSLTLTREAGVTVRVMLPGSATEGGTNLAQGSSQGPSPASAALPLSRSPVMNDMPPPSQIPDYPPPPPPAQTTQESLPGVTEEGVEEGAKEAPPQPGVPSPEGGVEEGETKQAVRFEPLPVRSASPPRANQLPPLAHAPTPVPAGGEESRSELT
eukprot:Hpha_TRINITY_DN17215_c0_g1::TRINITY_DN17215_c0_g1_i1::g.17764::m.17764